MASSDSGRAVWRWILVPVAICVTLLTAPRAAHGQALPLYTSTGITAGFNENAARHSVHADGDGRVFVADFYNHRIQVFDAEGGFLAAWGNTGPAAQRLDRPTDVATGPDGTVYVVDFGHDRVQRYGCTTCEAP